jgi:hypothetical protein
LYFIVTSNAVLAEQSMGRRMRTSWFAAGIARVFSSADVLRALGNLRIGAGISM